MSCKESPPNYYISYKKNRNYLFVLVLIVILSAFVHVWNTIGFPDIHLDEGHYVRRAMEVLSGQGPQENELDFDHPCDHHYFGQLFLAMLLEAVWYPDSIHPEPRIYSDALCYPKNVNGDFLQWLIL